MLVIVDSVLFIHATSARRYWCYILTVPPWNQPDIGNKKTSRERFSFSGVEQLLMLLGFRLHLRD